MVLGEAWRKPTVSGLDFGAVLVLIEAGANSLGAYGLGPPVLEQSCSYRYGSPQSGSLESRPTHFGAGLALTVMGAYSLAPPLILQQYGRLQSGSLQSRATDFGAVLVLTGLGAYNLGAYNVVPPILEPFSYLRVWAPTVSSY